ncbi:MAG: molybdopterin-dependent oxidoreductase [Pseudomonadota bacterium]
MDGLDAPVTRSTCPYCGVGCGVLLRADGAGGLGVTGDPDHPANQGRLCSKGSALGETVGLDDRLLVPQVGGQDWSWDSALDLVATRLRATIAAHGPDSVAFYVSGQLLTEDYYVANKLMKGFIGSANIDTNSRLCMASTVAGHKRAFGTDTVPGTYEDLDQADLIVLVGSNMAWCHPVLFQRVQAARATNPDLKLVVVDPRRTASCVGADLHLPLRSGTDVALFNGLLAQIDQRGLIDPGFAAHLEGLEDAVAAACADDPSVTGLDPADLAAFYEMWCSTQKVVTVFSQGVNQSTSGTDKVGSILNCHLATGRIGQPGLGPLSVTGQPNAMGGREVGGLANMLACHMNLENSGHRQAVRSFWDAPAMPDAPGLKAVEMFQGVASGKIKALWVIHTNPAVSLPDAGAVADAIAACPFTIVSDITAHTDTARLADVLLPATAWAEKSGTVTNSDRTISRQRAVLPAPGEAKDDWHILAEVGQRMGWPAAFDYAGPSEIFREHAALSAIAAGFGLDFDISGLMNLSDLDYDRLSPTRWPVSKTGARARFFADGQFYTPSGKGRLQAVRYRPPAAKTAPRFPYRLNTGRVRDQWHTMTRTAKSPRLSAHLAEPYLEIHPQDARDLNLAPAALVQVTAPSGRTSLLRALITDAVRPGEVFAPMHWTGETAPCARIDTVVAAATDPISGQPESKASVVALSPYRARWYGFVVSAGALSPKAAYWARMRTTAGWRAELADQTAPQDWEGYFRDLTGLGKAHIQSVSDRARTQHRFAAFEGDRLVAALFVAPEPIALTRDYLAGLPGTQAGAEVLSGQAPVGRVDPGPVVCSCFGVGINTLVTAIEGDGLLSVEAVGAALQAGTNCGSCRSEIAQLIERHQVREAAE